MSVTSSMAATNKLQEVYEGQMANDYQRKIAAIEKRMIDIRTDENKKFLKEIVELVLDKYPWLSETPKCERRYSTVADAEHINPMFKSNFFNEELQNLEDARVALNELRAEQRDALADWYQDALFAVAQKEALPEFKFASRNRDNGNGNGRG